uniref:Skin secreted peptide P1-3 n=1 Tax=Phasmahyla jandaia TaxID=762504 RepID=SSP13_PHAJA|nr:RecName: Full=Skin secreted peptide P1-3; Short=PjP1-3 [Phasmahyla jandaia]
KPEEDWGRES